VQAGVEKAPLLRVLYASNNKIRDWAEVDRLVALTRLEDLLLIGNPLHNDYRDRGALPEYRIEVDTQTDNRYEACSLVILP
jgi:dynein light chain 1, axonemal